MAKENYFRFAIDGIVLLASLSIFAVGYTILNGHCNYLRIQRSDDLIEKFTSWAAVVPIISAALLSIMAGFLYKAKHWYIRTAILFIICLSVAFIPFILLNRYTETLHLKRPITVEENFVLTQKVKGRLIIEAGRNIRVPRDVDGKIAKDYLVSIGGI